MSSKQINYWLEFDGFLQVAQKALELGCTIIREDLNAGTVTESNDIGVIAEDTRISYYFHFPEAGKILIENTGHGERLDRYANECGNSIIEAGYSVIDDDNKWIISARLFLNTGYYDEDRNFIYRPDCIVKVYEKLVRFVKKLAPYTEVTYSFPGLTFNAKEYVSPLCLDLLNKGYSIRAH